MGLYFSDISLGASWLANMVFINGTVRVENGFQLPGGHGRAVFPPPTVLIAVHVFNAKADQPVCPVWKPSALRDVLYDDDRQRANCLLEYSRTF